MTNSIFLCSTFHDPELKLEGLIKRALPIINELFPTKILACTQVTIEGIREICNENNFIVVGTESSRVVDTYLLAFKTAFKSSEDENQKFFYIDFDRLVHWVLQYPEELKSIIKKEHNYDYLHIARSDKAFESHPNTQKDTESIINRIGSTALGLHDVKDLISVCFIFTKDLCKNILDLEYTTSRGFYGLWPIIFWSNSSERNYIEVEGLEWETPDRFIQEIKEIGYSIWIEKFQNANEWKKRIQFIDEFIRELENFTEINLFYQIKSRDKSQM